MGERICVGAITGAFGVKGDVRLKSFCAQPEAIVAYAPLWTSDGSRSFTLKLTRGSGAGLTARLSGINSKEEADALRGVELFADRDRLPNLPDDEFYHSDLIGLEVLDTSGTHLGAVRAVYNHGAGDILEVAGPGLKATLLLPFTKAIVPTVDLTARRVIVDPPVESADE
ncbi:MAG: ribosome maturation factor RimM [Paracoccaceae bacterium]